MSLRDPSPELWKRMQAMNTTDAHAVAKQYADVLPGEERAPEQKGRNGRTRAQESAAQSKRQQSGAKFEAQLDDTHEWLTGQRFGHIIPHYPPTKMIPQRSGPPKLVYRKGGGPCDYSGHVNFSTRERASDWVLERDPAARWLRQVPVVFDAKTLTAGRASYVHSVERIAQVEHLKHAHAGGALAFLLVRADEVQRVFAVAYHLHADDLLRARPIKLFDPPLADGSRFPLLPSVTYTPGKGWLWPSLLPWLR